MEPAGMRQQEDRQDNALGRAALEEGGLLLLRMHTPIMFAMGGGGLGGLLGYGIGQYLSGWLLALVLLVPAVVVGAIIGVFTYLVLRFGMDL